MAGCREVAGGRVMDGGGGVVGGAARWRERRAMEDNRWPMVVVGESRRARGGPKNQEVGIQDFKRYS